MKPILKEGQSFINTKDIYLSFYYEGGLYVFTDLDGKVMTGYIRGLRDKWYKRLWRWVAARIKNFY